MTLLQIMHALIECDPYDIVKAEMDGFDAYTTISMPRKIAEAAEELNGDEDEEFMLFCDTYMEHLREMSFVKDAKQAMLDSILPLPKDQLVYTVLETMKEAVENNKCNPCVNCGCEKPHRNCRDLVIEQELIRLVVRFRKEHNRYMVHNVIHTLRTFREGCGLV